MTLSDADDADAGDDSSSDYESESSEEVKMKKKKSKDEKKKKKKSDKKEKKEKKKKVCYNAAIMVVLYTPWYSVFRRYHYFHKGQRKEKEIQKGKEEICKEGEAETSSQRRRLFM
jgi:hypothetical protein